MKTFDSSLNIRNWFIFLLACVSSVFFGWLIAEGNFSVSLLIFLSIAFFLIILIDVKIGLTLLVFSIAVSPEIPIPGSELGQEVVISIRFEDVLIAVFVGMGVAILSFSPVGLPLQFQFYFLGMLLSAVQALVFTLLSTIYILLMLPHEEHAH